MPAAAPVATPPVPVMPNVPGADEVQLPPPVASVKVEVLPKHSEDTPVMPGGVVGIVLTVITMWADVVPQVLVITYFMVSVPADTAVMTPDEEMVATAEEELQVPPGVASVRVPVLPTQYTDVPVMAAGTTGRGLTVTIAKVEEVPQLLLRMYLMESVPPETPLTIPEVLPTVAMPVAVLIHTPPGTVSPNVVVLPAHTVSTPVMGAGGAGTVFTVNMAHAEVLPQVLVLVYFMVSVPLVSGVTTPPVEMVAIPVLTLDQAPPAVASVSDVVEPKQRLRVPEIAAGTAGAEFTVIDLVADALPQLLVLV